MLGYFMTTVPVALRARVQRDGQLVSRLPRRVKLKETDFNAHMNQARYAEVAELGRVDWFVRSGVFSDLRSQGIKPIVAEQRIIYRRELKPLQRYVIDTRATGFDGRLLCIDSLLLVGDRVHAKVEAKLICIGSDGVLSEEASQAACRGYLTEPLQVEDWRVR